jgi:hypothetical protein
MRCLVISANSEPAEFFDREISKAGHDVFLYRDIFQALANLDTIRPNKIICNASDFPRHWKLIPSILGYPLRETEKDIFIFSQTSISNKELEKAQALNVHYLENMDEFVSKILPPFSELAAPNEKIAGSNSVYYQEEHGADVSLTNEGACIVTSLNPRRIQIHSLFSFEQPIIKIENPGALMQAKDTLHFQVIFNDSQTMQSKFTVIPRYSTENEFLIIENNPL